MRTAPQTHGRVPHGFTLIELLTVMGIVSLMLVLAVPAVRTMRSDSDRSVGQNTVAMAGTIARAYATRQVNPVSDAELATNTAPADNEPGSYSGCAALFTPSNEIRIVENNQRALASASRTSPNGDTVRALERFWWDGSPNPAAMDWGEQPQRVKHLNGFRDLQLDYIRLPSDTGVAGVIRLQSNTNTEPTLIPPPFAVWFDANGNMVVGRDGELNGYVYYDGDYDGVIDINRTRVSTGYTHPYTFDPTMGEFLNGNYDATARRYDLPFERIETVAAVFIYSKRALRNSNVDWTNAGATNAQRWQWMKENGAMLMFTRQTGGAMRDLMDTRR